MIELVVESERRTQLLDITQAVNERLAGSAARAVLVFVPSVVFGSPRCDAEPVGDGCAYTWIEDEPPVVEVRER